MKTEILVYPHITSALIYLSMNAVIMNAVYRIQKMINPPIVLVILISTIVIFYFLSSMLFGRTTFPTVVPEYNRSMKKVLITVDRSKLGIQPHLELLKRLPEYTEILILAPDELKQTVSRQIEGLDALRKIRIVPYSTKTMKNVTLYSVFPDKDKLIELGPIKEQRIPFGSLWAQDLFEPVIMANGLPALLISDVYKWFVPLSGSGPENVLSDNFFLSSISNAGIDVRRLPITFRGGNILFDDFQGKKLAFCGGDVLRLTQTVWKSTRGTAPSEKQVLEMIKKYFHVDDVYIIGKTKVQPSLLFHLDQAMVFLDDGVVGITRIVNEPANSTVDDDEIWEVKQFLTELKSILVKIGYRTINIDATVDDVRNLRYYVNSIPYKDLSTGQRSIFMPAFPTNINESDQSILRGNIARIESLGYKVSLVPTDINKINGGLHCILNVLN